MLAEDQLVDDKQQSDLIGVACMAFRGESSLWILEQVLNYFIENIATDCENIVGQKR